MRLLFKIDCCIFRITIQKLFFKQYIYRPNVWEDLALLWLSSKKFGFVQTREEGNVGGWCLGQSIFSIVSRAWCQEGKIHVFFISKKMIRKGKTHEDRILFLRSLNLPLKHLNSFCQISLRAIDLLWNSRIVCLD